MNKSSDCSTEDRGHTPGPWRKSKGRKRGYRIFAGSRFVATIQVGERATDDELRANAELIESCPELLMVAIRLRTALERCRAELKGYCYEVVNPEDEEAIQMADAAIVAASRIIQKASFRRTDYHP